MSQSGLHETMIETAECHVHGFELSMLYRPGSADEKVLRHSFDRDIFLREIPEYLPHGGHTIVDIGAHIGTFACLLGRIVPSARIHAIEACRETYALLEENVQRNKLSNIRPAHLVLLDRCGKATLYHDLAHGNWGHSAVAQLSADTEEVTCCSLEAFVAANSIDRIDLLRMNCEGAEFPVLLGTPLAVLRRITSILILHHAYLAPAYSVHDLTNYLLLAGFRVRLTNVSSGEGWIIASRAQTPLWRMARYRLSKRAHGLAESARSWLRRSTRVT